MTPSNFVDLSLISNEGGCTYVSTVSNEVVRSKCGDGKCFQSAMNKRSPLCVPPYSILQFDARVQEAFCTPRETRVCHSTMRLDSRVKVPSPFQWTRPHCHRRSLSLIQSPLSLAWFPRASSRCCWTLYSWSVYIFISSTSGCIAFTETVSYLINNTIFIILRSFFFDVLRWVF